MKIKAIIHDHTKPMIKNKKSNTIVDKLSFLKMKNKQAKQLLHVLFSNSILKSIPNSSSDQTHPNSQEGILLPPLRLSPSSSSALNLCQEYYQQLPKKYHRINCRR